MGPYVWFLPAFLVIAFVLIYPMVWSLSLSFHQWRVIYATPPVYVGLQNYVQLLGDSFFQEVVLRTITLVIIVVTLQFLVGFSLALLLHSDIKGRYVYVVLFTIPMFLTPSIAALMWKQILQKEWGVLNYVLSLIGFQEVGWLSDPSITFTTIVMLLVWQQSPFFMLFLLAGLQSIPVELTEVAKLDGATSLQIFRHITLPWLIPLLSIAILFRTMFTLRTFDVVYGLWRSSGPVNRGMVLGVYLYDKFKSTWQLGLSSSIAYILLLLTILLGIVFAIITFKRGKI